MARKQNGTSPPVRRQNGIDMSSRNMVFYLGFAMSFAVNVGTIGYIYANVLNKIEANALAIANNAAADKDRAISHDAAIARIDTSLNAMGALRTDVEVMRTSLINISDTLRRLERQWEGKSPQR